MMIKAASFPIEKDLSGFNRFLQQQGIPHRINEQSGLQVVWVEHEQHLEVVQRALDNWTDQHEAAMDALADQKQSSSTGKVLINALTQGFKTSPITLILISICLGVAAYSMLGAQAYRVTSWFYPLLDPDSLLGLLGGINSVEFFLRTLSPMFLHFGELHLVFNLLWLWYFGKQLEAEHPVWLYALLIVLTSFVSNTTQFMTANFNNFGGMSGVVYGLVGYTWVVHTFMPKSKLLIDNKMFVVFVIALVAMEVFASTWIATAAHIGGLLSGLGLGLLMVLSYRFLLGRDSIGRPKKSQLES